MTQKNIYISATDTDAGKTVITALLYDFLLARRVNAVTQKPIQSGCTDFPEDIEAHLNFVGKSRSDIDSELLELICPYRLTLPASAHLAARIDGVEIDSQKIIDANRQLCKRFDIVLIEGIGGVLVPASTTGKEKFTISDTVAQLNCPAIVIANNKLGVINHTLLTIEALKSRGIAILGFLFNGRDKNSSPQILADNHKAISDYAEVDFLGELSWNENIEQLKPEFAPIAEEILHKLG